MEALSEIPGNESEMPRQFTCNLRPGPTGTEKGGTSLHPCPTICVTRIKFSEPDDQLRETLIEWSDLGQSFLSH